MGLYIDLAVIQGRPVYNKVVDEEEGKEKGRAVDRRGDEEHQEEEGHHEVDEEVEEEEEEEEEVVILDTIKPKKRPRTPDLNTQLLQVSSSDSHSGSFEGATTCMTNGKTSHALAECRQERCTPRHSSRRPFHPKY